MVKKLTLFIALPLLLAALPTAAQSPCNTGNDLAWLSETAPEATAPSGDFGDYLLSLFPAPEPAAAVDSTTPATIELARKPRGMAKAVCNEDCNELPDISCSGSVCNAVSRNCSMDFCERGSVTCDGVTTFCSQACPPNCTSFECKQGCAQPGCVAVCLNRCTCECETICQ